jgi:DNA-binding CsgD family transcriptional regulator
MMLQTLPPCTCVFNRTSGQVLWRSTTFDNLLGGQDTTLAQLCQRLLPLKQALQHHIDQLTVLHGGKPLDAILTFHVDGHTTLRLQDRCTKGSQNDLADPAKLIPAQQAFAQRMAKLTAREGQVISLVVQGKLNKTIADILGISIKTVELHRKNGMTKLGARSVVELTRCVITGQT